MSPSDESDVQESFCFFVPQTSCKSAVAFFQFSILANYFWLLVEGMYLQTLLTLTFVFQKKYFWWYILIGWGGYLTCHHPCLSYVPVSFHVISCFSSCSTLVLFLMIRSLCLCLPGLPTVIITAWILTRNFYDNRGWATAAGNQDNIKLEKI